jgi:hypothetical protein
LRNHPFTVGQGKVSGPVTRMSQIEKQTLPSDPRFGENNILLLRLFKSEFFNEWIAVYYLFKYIDNDGILNIPVRSKLISISLENKLLICSPCAFHDYNTLIRNSRLLV